MLLSEKFQNNTGNNTGENKMPTSTRAPTTTQQTIIATDPVQTIVYEENNAPANIGPDNDILGGPSDNIGPQNDIIEVVHQDSKTFFPLNEGFKNNNKGSIINVTNIFKSLLILVIVILVCANKKMIDDNICKFIKMKGTKNKEMCYYLVKFILIYMVIQL